MPHTNQLLPIVAVEAVAVETTVGRAAATAGVLDTGGGAVVRVGGTTVSVAVGNSVAVAVTVAGTGVAVSVKAKLGVRVLLGRSVAGSRVGVAVAVGGTGVGVSFSFGGETGTDSVGVFVGTVCRLALCSDVAHTALTDSDAAKMTPHAKTVKTRSDFILHPYPLGSRKRTMTWVSWVIGNSNCNWPASMDVGRGAEEMTFAPTGRFSVTTVGMADLPDCFCSHNEYCQSLPTRRTTPAGKP
jgi:hypothetical protein